MAVRTRKPVDIPSHPQVHGRVPNGVPPLQHQRLWSRSTTASCSPVTTSPRSQNAGGCDGANLPTKMAAAVTKLTKPQKSKIPAKPKLAKESSPKGLKTGQRRRKLRFGISDANAASANAPPTNAKATTGPSTAAPAPLISVAPQMPARTPYTAAVRSHPAKPELIQSPGGTDYIVTPGRHRIEMNEFLSSFDASMANNGCPRMRGTANYAENMHREWLLAEQKLDTQVFLLSFPSDSAMEKFRQMAIQSVFNYAVENQLHENTIHLTVLNIHRLIVERIRRRDKELTTDIFACTVLAALRNAIKVDEGYEKSDRFRIDPDHVWRASKFLADVCSDKSSKRLNELEGQCMSVLGDPANPPLAPEFLERYLAVGNWPLYKESYQELGSFLLGLALFAHGSENPLKGIPSSKLAGAALALAVKVINTDACYEKYEFWPDRLVGYTGFSIEDLKPAIRGLAHLLRHKPEQSYILERYYTKWGVFDWS